jgi:hypothetical protein
MNTFTFQPQHMPACAFSARIGARAEAWVICGNDFIDAMNTNKALRTLQPGAQCLSRVRDKRS